MRKIIYIFLISTILFSCQKAEIDNVFDKSPEERVGVNISALNKKLIDSKEGWLAYYIYDNDNAKSIITLKFLDNTRVEILFHAEKSDDDKDAVENEAKISNYRLDYTQQLNLTFDTFSTFSQLVENELAADFRWELVSNDDNKISFVSRNEKAEGITYLNLEKFTDEKLEAMEKRSKVSKFITGVDLGMQINGNDIEVIRNGFNFTFNYKEGDENKSVEAPFVITDKGIELLESINILGEDLHEFILDKDKKQLISTDGKNIIQFLYSPLDFKSNSYTIDTSIEDESSEAFRAQWANSQLAQQNVMPALPLSDVLYLGPVLTNNIPALTSKIGDYFIQYNFAFVGVLGHKDYLGIRPDGGGYNWSFVSHLTPFIVFISGNSPYKVELLEGEPAKYKLTSVANADIWFVMN